MRIEIPVFDGFDELDAVGPYEVLRNASQMGADAGWDVALVGAHGEVIAAHGLRLSATDGLGHPDAVLVPVGWTGRTPRGTWQEVQAGVLPARLAELSPSCRWIARCALGRCCWRRPG
jgi:putative intracellular protease/amidase